MTTPRNAAAESLEHPLSTPKPIWRAALDFAFFPVRAGFGHRTVERLGLTSLKQERMRAVWFHLEGRLLDVGCGTNALVRAYRESGGDGVGIDVHPWEGVDTVCDTTDIPFEDGSFDTATMLAVLNHVPQENRVAVLTEMFRLLRPGGRLVITGLSPKIGWLRHKLAWWDPDKKRRWHQGESDGLTNKAIDSYLEDAGFTLRLRRRFAYGLNHVHVFVKADHERAR